jgi:hypothetical protein
MSCIILSVRWCYVVVLNVHAPCENKGDDVQDKSYEELVCVFDQFPRNAIKNVFGDISTKVADKISPNRQSGTHEISNDNGV